MLSREETLQLGTYNPGFAENVKPFNADHRSIGTLRLLPVQPENLKDYEVHHVMGLQDHLRPLIQGLAEHQQKAIMHRLLAKGVVFGQNPDNLIALNEGDHTKVHRHMEDIGIDRARNLVNSIANLPYEQRLIAADTFAEQIYPAIVEQMQILGHEVPSIQDNINKYNASIEEERRIENKKDNIQLAKEMYGSKATIDNIRKIRDSEMPIAGAASPGVTRMAGDAIRQLSGRDMSALTTGNVSGDKPIIVNADEGANVLVHTNGKNGNGHADMQKEFGETSRRLKR